MAGDYLAEEWNGRKVAILHDGATYGKGLADETKAQLNKRGVTEATYEAYTPGKSDYSAEIAALQAADIAVLYVGGYHAEVALMARAARDRGYCASIRLRRYFVDRRLCAHRRARGRGPALYLWRRPAPKRRGGAHRRTLPCRGLRACGYTLSTYAAVQVWAQAVEKAGSLELQAVIASLRSHQFDTALGAIDFDDKGDLTEQSWVWYVWRGGEYVPLE